MHRATSGRLVWRSAAILLGLLVFQASAPEARASCGDYVHFGKARAGEQVARETPGAPAPKPCTSPSCSHRKPVPLPPSPAPSAPAAEQWALIAVPRLPNALSTLSWLSLELVARPGPDANDIFHPPRP